MKEALLRRGLNQPLQKRLYQIINGAIVFVAGDRLGVVHVLEYPKCGGSWVRNMLQTYFASEPYFNDRIISPKTVVHLHRQYKKIYSHPVVLFRDPRDVMISFYFHEKMYQSTGDKMAIHRYFTFTGSEDVKNDFADYLAVKLTKNTDPYFHYAEFIRSWLNRDGVCYTSYEGFRTNPEEELKRVLISLGEPYDENKAKHSIEYNNFENATLRKYGVARQSGVADNQRFQRKGIVGDWTNYCNEKSRKILCDHFGELLIELGYESDKHWVKQTNQ